MYTNYFRLSEPPFSLTPDPRYLFMSERHREGLAHLFYGVQQPGGFVQLTGEIGSGKTTLSRCLVRQLPPETEVALILNPRLTAIELLANVCDELAISYPAETESIKVLIDALNQHLLDAHAHGKKTVLIIDEAQNLSSDVLEQIRLLTNLETSQEKLLQIILIGQPELLTVLKRKGLRQLAQRITARYHLLPLSRKETYAYIQHRLLVGGCRDPLFTGSAIRNVYYLSGGVPRLINIICDRALLGAYAEGKRRITARIVRQASRETRGAIPWYRRPLLAWSATVAAFFILILVGALLFRPLYPLLARKNGTVARPVQNSVAADQTTAVKAAPASPGPGAVPASQPRSEAIPEKKPEPAKKPAETAAAAASARLAELLSQSANPVSAYQDLYARWGLKAPSNAAEPCTSAQQQGFECLSLMGSWPKLRRYNVPAILEVLTPAGGRRHVTLVGLSQETATLLISGREYGFPLPDVDRVWDGSFTILWKPPFAIRQLAPGTRGEEVVWVRRALDTLDKARPATTVSDIFDDELRQRVLAFQQERSLIRDGYVGNETLVRLTLALDGPNTPSLSGNAR
jgi:general secretion pathway protein A